MHSMTGVFKPDASGAAPKQMEYIPRMKLNDGNEMPMLAYGLGTARSGSQADDNVKDLTVMAMKNGYLHLDGAESYKNEAELGAAIAASNTPRSSLFITTKLQPSRHAIADIPSALDASLSRLGLEYVDLYLIHAPFSYRTPADLQAAWAQMEACRARGKARSIGVSNFLASHLETVLQTARTKPAVNQIEFHPYLQHRVVDVEGGDGGLLGYMRARDVAAVAYAPLTALTRAAPGPVDALYADLARKYGVEPGEVALRWCLDQGVAAVTTSAREERLAGFVNRLPGFKLTPKEVEEISEKGREKHFRGFWTNKFEEGDRR
ncbi:aldo/keto reductase [Xylariomycetidae sp. FL0641]|nr:aldo/keto reductase [Xylariomycetidae sp. FL0641]